MAWAARLAVVGSGLAASAACNGIVGNDAVGLWDGGGESEGKKDSSATSEAGGDSGASESGPTADSSSGDANGFDATAQDAAAEAGVDAPGTSDGSNDATSGDSTGVPDASGESASEAQAGDSGPVPDSGGGDGGGTDASTQDSSADSSAPADSAAPDAGAGEGGADSGVVACTSTPSALVTDSQLSTSVGFGVAVDSTYVYWSNPALAKINRRALAGGAVQEIVSGISSPQHIAVDATYVYWADAGAGNFAKAYKDGSGGTQVLSSGYNSPTAISVFGGTAYLSNGKIENISVSPGAVWAIDLSTLGTTSVASNYGTGQPFPYDVTVVEGTIYWANEGNNTIDYVTSPGGTVNTLAVTSQGPTGLVNDGQALYWTNVNGNTISKYTLATATQTTAVSGQTTGHGLAIDANCLYWGLVDVAQIWAVTKP